LKEREGIEAIRKVIIRIAEGRGLASGTVAALQDSSRAPDADVARRTFLGEPPSSSFKALAREGGFLAITLSEYLAAESAYDLKEAGSRASRLADLFGRWVGLYERLLLEGKVQAFRGHIVSAVLGAVLGLFTSIAPLVGDLQFTLNPTPVDWGALPYAAAAMTFLSALYLGVFLSKSHPHLDILIALGAFLLVWELTAPLGSFSSLGVLGVK
jgi:hypothetical protein